MRMLLIPAVTIFATTAAFAQQGVVVGLENLKRTASGNVQGELRLKWNETIAGKDVILLDVRKAFDFPRAGVQQLLDQGFDVGIVKVTAKVKVFEKPGNQACVQGRLEGKAVAVDLGKDLDENCRPIP